MTPPELSIVVPCYNEAQNLPTLVERFAPFYPETAFEMILVDNGSRDDSAEVLKRLQAKHPEWLRVVTISTNIGYGHGILSGLKTARAAILAYTHADIQTPPEDVFRALRLWKASPAADTRRLVKGFRTNRREDRQFMTRWLARVVQWMLGYRIEDINGQPKLFTQAFYKSWRQPPTDFSLDVYVMFEARVQGLRVETFPVDYGVREHGESKWAANVKLKYKTILKYLASIFLMAVQHYRNPVRFFQRLLKWGRA